jgi:hypothetical protein
MSKSALIPLLCLLMCSFSLLACSSEEETTQDAPNASEAPAATSTAEGAAATAAPEVATETPSSPPTEAVAPAREAPRVSPTPDGYEPAEMAMGWPMDPTCMERCEEVRPPDHKALGGAGVRASSSLKEGERVYGPQLAFDGDMSTAWCEGADGLGVGEWIEIPLVSAEFSHVQIWPGYLKSDAHLENNGSPKRYRVSHKDWAFEVVNTTVRLDPERWPQHGFVGDYTDFTGTSGHVVQPEGVGHDSFALEGADAVGDVVRIQILEANPGKKHEDICISEVRLTAIMPPAD